MLEVNERGHDEPGQHQAPRQRQQWRLSACRQPVAQKGHPGEQLDKKVAHRDAPLTVGASAPQSQPGHQRHIPIPRNGIAAMRTMRRRRDNTQPSRQPVNADVKKAADRAAKHEKGKRPEVEGHRCPDRGIKGAGHGGEQLGIADCQLAIGTELLTRWN